MPSTKGFLDQPGGTPPAVASVPWDPGDVAGLCRPSNVAYYTEVTEPHAQPLPARDTASLFFQTFRMWLIMLPRMHWGADSFAAVCG